MTYCSDIFVLCFCFSCPESIAIVANVSKHTKYITTTLGFIQDQITKHPSIMEELQVRIFR